MSSLSREAHEEYRRIMHPEGEGGEERPGG
jgi:hypothetical protein